MRPGPRSGDHASTFPTIGDPPCPNPCCLPKPSRTRKAPPRPRRNTLSSGAQGITTVGSDIAQLPFLQHLSQVLPAADVAFGGAMLMLIIVIHATGVRAVTGHVAHRSRIIMLRPKVWRADLLMTTSILLLLALHLTETIVWAAALVESGLVPSWRAAGFFAGNTYTTVGYGTFVLPVGWEMVAPIIAISGLFTFGWSGSVLVDIVARCQRIKDAVIDRRKVGARTPTRSEARPHGAAPGLARSDASRSGVGVWRLTGPRRCASPHATSATRRARRPVATASSLAALPCSARARTPCRIAAMRNMLNTR